MVLGRKKKAVDAQQSTAETNVAGSEMIELGDTSNVASGEHRSSTSRSVGGEALDAGTSSSPITAISGKDGEKVNVDPRSEGNMAQASAVVDPKPPGTLARAWKWIKEVDLNPDTAFKKKRPPPCARSVYFNEPLPLEAFHEKKARGKAEWTFATNQVLTAKYTVFNFIFKNLLEQFRRVANIFFLREYQSASCVHALGLLTSDTNLQSSSSCNSSPSSRPSLLAWRCFPCSRFSR